MSCKTGGPFQAALLAALCAEGKQRQAAAPPRRRPGILVLVNDCDWELRWGACSGCVLGRGGVSCVCGRARWCYQLCAGARTPQQPTALQPCTLHSLVARCQLLTPYAPLPPMLSCSHDSIMPSSQRSHPSLFHAVAAGCWSASCATGTK